jgi:glutathione peroxidase
MSKNETNFYDLSATTITGEEQSMADYKGKVVLVVNTASKCGFTPQYAGLQELYERYQSKGLVILGFPCDQFAHQEPGSEEEIAEFCQMNYGVTFPMFAKVDVNGKNTHPVIQLLKDNLKSPLGKAIKWNFTKFLIGPDGTPLKRYEPTVTPEAIEPDIQQQLP